MVCTVGVFHANESGYNKVAAELNGELRRLRVDLPRRLYPYVEILTELLLNILKDWRDVAD